MVMEVQQLRPPLLYAIWFQLSTCTRQVSSRLCWWNSSKERIYVTHRMWNRWSERARSLIVLMMLEVSVERAHALGKMESRQAPHHSEAFLSFGSQIHFVENRMEVDLNTLAELGEACKANSKSSMYGTEHALHAAPAGRECFKRAWKPKHLLNCSGL